MIHAPIDPATPMRPYPELFSLEPTDFYQAAQLSDPISGERQQWQTYLRGLALLGFTNWLRERLSDMAVIQEGCSTFQPSSATAVDAVCNLRVGLFSVCLIVTEHVWDEQIKVPRATLDLPEFAAHFYVVLEVQEEQEQVAIQGFARYDQLDRYRRSHPIPINQDWSYSFPLDGFDAEPNHLLLNLRWLSPIAIPLPASVTHPSLQISPLPNASTLDPIDLAHLLHNLESPQRRLWECLHWEQGMRVLQHPELLNSLYQWQRSLTNRDSLAIRLTELLTLLLQRTIQIGRWVQGELDEVAQQLGLFLPQALAPVAPMLSIDRFEAAIAELADRGMDIPIEPSRAYQDFDWQGLPLRLCIVTWLREPSDMTRSSAPVWSLLFILGMQTNTPLPDGLKLRVSNLTGMLHEPTTELDDPFLFARVQGHHDETFVVTVIPTNCPPLTLSPYRLQAV